jgi:hypothetical protein
MGLKYHSKCLASEHIELANLIIAPAAWGSWPLHFVAECQSVLTATVRKISTEQRPCAFVHYSPIAANRRSAAMRLQQGIRTAI